VRIEKSSLRTPGIFGLIAERGGIPERDMYNTFNMGVGMTVCVAKHDADTALAILREQGEAAYVMGELREGTEGVRLC